MQRSERVADAIKKELANLLQNEIKDPRLPEMASVVAVEVTRDLSLARVYISVLGNDEEKKDCQAAIESASGFIRREIGKRVRLRKVPELRFKIDDSIERGMRISRLIDETMAGQASDLSDHEEED